MVTLQIPAGALKLDLSVKFENYRLCTWSGRFQMEPYRASPLSEVSRNWAGEPLDSYQKILYYARTTQTQTGLEVTAYLDRRYYACGLKPTADQIASLRLQHHETLPQWNYTIKPQL